MLMYLPPQTAGNKPWSVLGHHPCPLEMSVILWPYRRSSEDTKKLSNINGLFAASSNTPRISSPFLSWSRSTFRLLRIVCSIRLSTKSCRFNTWKANDMTKSNCNWIIFGSVHYMVCLPFLKHIRIKYK